MIKIKNLTVTSNDDPLLSNINMTIEAGEIHAITGPKFSGKSALAHVITGHPGITIEKGSIHWGSTKTSQIGIYFNYFSKAIHQKYLIYNLNTMHTVTYWTLENSTAIFALMLVK